ncbi:WD40 repeat domain-containing protein [Brachybacterium epidermidis]|uniref:WD40 repeat domain-containing protein n=1 Tax=Brachybacterium epidermidis TaxID=2781983 RepID=UPI00398E6DAF
MRGTRRWLLGAASGSALTVLSACRATEGEEQSSCIPATGPDPGPSESGTSTEEVGAAGRAGPRKSSVLSPVGLAVSPDGTLVAANQTWDRKFLDLSVSDGTVLWDTSDGRIVHRFDNGASGAIAWHPDGDLLAIGGQSRVFLTDASGSRSWTLAGHARDVDPFPLITDLDFSPDGSALASLSTDGTVRLWSVSSSACEPRKVLRVRGMRARSLSFSPDGSTLAICGPGGTPELWDPASGRRVSRLRDLDATAFGVAHASDGTLLIGTGDEDLQDPAEPPALYLRDPAGDIRKGPQPPNAAAEMLAVSESGKRVAVGGEVAQNVMVWDRDSDERQDPPRVGSTTARLRWAPDETVLYAVGVRTSVLAWAGSDWSEFETP